MFFLLFLGFLCVSDKISKKLLFEASFLPLFCLIYSKLFLYGKSDIFNYENLMSVFNKLIDLSRYKLILIQYINNIFNILNLVIIFIIAIFTGIKKDFTHLKNAEFILICIFICYSLIYLITPHDLYWHLLTSSMRLFAQYVPLIILWIFLRFNCLEKQ